MARGSRITPAPYEKAQASDVYNMQACGSSKQRSGLDGMLLQHTYVCTRKITLNATPDGTITFIPLL